MVPPISNQPTDTIGQAIEHAVPTFLPQQPEESQVAPQPNIVDLPVLTEVVAPAHPGPALASEPGLTVLQEGWSFNGRAKINGTCSLGGHFEGHLEVTLEGTASVVVTPTGMFIGDLSANQVAISGLYSGALNAAGGTVVLNDSAVVSGHIRYAKLQVNGADLNATLERVIALHK